MKKVVVAVKTVRKYVVSKLDSCYKYFDLYNCQNYILTRKRKDPSFAAVADNCLYGFDGCQVYSRNYNRQIC